MKAWTYVPEKEGLPSPAVSRLQGAAVAACCVVMCTFGFFYLVTGGFRGLGSTAPGNRCTGTAADSADAGNPLEAAAQQRTFCPMPDRCCL